MNYEEALAQSAIMRQMPGMYVVIREPSIGNYYCDYERHRSMGMGTGMAVMAPMELHHEHCKHATGNRSAKHHNIVLALNKRSKR